MEPKDILNKIASHIPELAAKAAQRDALIEKQAATSFLLKESSEALVKAANQIQFLEATMQKLAEEKERAELLLTTREKAEQATKLAKQMLHKGMIKRADYEGKIDDLMELSTEAFEVLSQTVDEMLVKQADYGQNALSKVSYLIDGEQDSSSSEKPDFSEAIVDRAKRL